MLVGRIQPRADIVADVEDLLKCLGVTTVCLRKGGDLSSHDITFCVLDLVFLFAFVVIVLGIV